MDIKQRGDEIVVTAGPVDPWKPFGEIACPKCELSALSQRIAICYCIGNAEYYGPMGLLLCAGVVEEHLHVECGRCNFRWLMETKSQWLARAQNAADAVSVTDHASLTDALKAHSWESAGDILQQRAFRNLNLPVHPYRYPEGGK